MKPIFSTRYGSPIHLTDETGWKVKALCGTVITEGRGGGCDKPTCEKCIKRAEKRKPK